MSDGKETVNPHVKNTQHTHTVTRSGPLRGLRSILGRPLVSLLTADQKPLTQALAYKTNCARGPPRFFYPLVHHVYYTDYFGSMSKKRQEQAGPFLDHFLAEQNLVLKLCGVSQKCQRKIWLTCDHRLSSPMSGISFTTLHVKRKLHGVTSFTSILKIRSVIHAYAMKYYVL